MKNLLRRALPALASLLALWLAPAPAAAQPCVSCFNESCPQLGSVLSPCAKPVKKAPPGKAKKPKSACPAGEVANEDTDYHCCFPGQYWDWDNASCEGEPTSCPAGRLPTPVGCGQASVLGFGGWRIYVAGSTAYLAYEGSPAPFAAAFFGSSNGWWYLRTPSGGDVTVFTDGSTLDGGMYGTPWASAASVTPTAFHDFTLSGDNGLATSFHDRSDYLEIDLSNGARVLLVRRSPVARLQFGKTDALFPKGASWPAGLALPPPAPVASVPAVPASPVVAGGTFGAAQQTFSYGGWSIRKRDNGKDVDVWWSADPRVAAEFIGDSNGWFHYRAEKETMVWSQGPSDTDDGSFYERPWEARSPVSAAASGSTFATTGQYGQTSYRLESDRLVVRTTNGGIAEFPKDSPAPRFTTNTGKAFALRTVPGLGGGSAPVATTSSAGGSFGTVGTTFGWLGWNIRRDADNGTYVWRASDRQLIAEIPNVTSGNWNYSSNGRKIIVWSDGPGDASDFPTTTAYDTSFPTALGAGASYSFSCDYGNVTLLTEADRLTATLPDNGRIVFSRSGAVTFVTSNGRSIDMPGGAPSSTALAAPAPAAASGSFGAATQTYTYGGWSIRKRQNGKDIDLWWTADARTGAEFIGDSNGWFHYRADRETMVWSQGPGEDDGSFYERPWTTPGPATPAAAGASFSTTGSYGDTLLRLDFDKITVRTTDGGIAEFPKDSPTPRYTTKAGKAFALRTAGAAVASAPAAATPIAATASSSAFGTTSVTYAWGGWAIRKRDNGKDIHVWWAADPRLAAEFIGDSNGWWHYRADQETIVWSQGPSDEGQDFYERPWTSRPVASPVSAGASFSVSGQYGSTAVSIGFDKLTVRLIDGGVVEFPKDSPTPRFATKGGSRFDLKRVPGISTTFQAVAPAPAAPAPAVPVAPIGTTLADAGPEQAFKAGGWQLYKPAGSGELYLWFGTGDAALCVGQDTNGWFYWRKGGKEEVVYSNGDQEPQQFLERPWERRSAAGAGLPATGLSLGGMYGTTKVVADAAKIVLTLVDGAKVELATDAPTATFRTAGGTASVLP